MSGKSFNIKRIGLMVLVVAGIAIAALSFLNGNGLHIIAGTKSNLLPERFNNIHTRDEAFKQLGEPRRKSLNTKWENKSPEEWRRLEKEASDLEASNSNPYGATGTDSSYSKLLAVRRSLAHKCKETWFYPDTEGSPNGWVLSFDADGNLLSVTRFSKPPPMGGPSASKHS